MIGLWGPNTAYGSENGFARKCHVAFAVSFDQLLAATKKLSEHGIETLGFGGNKTYEPTVIGWMPSAQIYFRDPDGHMLEFISILPDTPNPNFNGPYSEWKKLTTKSNVNQV
jgi:lactoylglutathione lyase